MEKKILHQHLLAIFLLFPINAFTQPSDFIILKRKHKTIHSYYSGSQVEFMTTNGIYRNALINVIKNDTIYVQEFLVQKIPTTLGTYLLDTAGSFRYAYHYKQINSFGPKPQKGFNIRGSGSSLMGGGILLVLGSGIVYVADRDKFSPGLMIAAGALAGLGYLMNRSGSSGSVIGKKGYSISYIDMTP